MMLEFEKLTFQNVFQVYAGMRAWARERKLWGQGNIVGSYTEYLVSRALDLTLCPPTTPGYDAIDQNEKKYQIKGLFDSDYLWAGWKDQEKLAAFDFLVCVIFDPVGNISRAYLVPQAVAMDAAKYGAQDMWWITFNEDLWMRAGVRSIADRLRHVCFEIEPTS